MNLVNWEQTTGRIERQERTSREHERLQARACIYSEAPRGRLSTQHEENVRQQILDGLIGDNGGDQQISTATRILAKVVASDASWLMFLNRAIDFTSSTNELFYNF